MYLEHFGLQHLPFNITPDTQFFCELPTHFAALNVLLVALRSGEGFIKITGEVGTGKTLLCRKILNGLSSESFVTCYIPNPFLTATALRMALAEELGLSFPRNIGQHRLLKLITHKLVENKLLGKNTVLLIDEAQALPAESLEALRLLTNLETEKYKLLQVVLFGQPELDERLNKKSVRQLKQRITFSYRLSPLKRCDVQAYINYRLQIAGLQDRSMFSYRAVRKIAKASRGIPRLVNILCHKSMMAAYGQGIDMIRTRHAKAAITDTEDTQPITPHRGQKLISAFGIIATLSAALGLYWWNQL